MNVSYDEEVDALAHKDALNALVNGEQFCPLIKQLCKTNCVCFYSAYVTKHGNNFCVQGFNCDNRMFFNE